MKLLCYDIFVERYFQFTVNLEINMESYSMLEKTREHRAKDDSYESEQVCE